MLGLHLVHDQLIRTKNRTNLTQARISDLTRFDCWSPERPVRITQSAKLRYGYASKRAMQCTNKIGIVRLRNSRSSA